MKEEMTHLNSHVTTCIDEKGAIKRPLSRQFSTLLTAEQVQESKTGIIVIPLENLSELQIRQFKELPEAYLLPSENSLYGDSSTGNMQQELVSKPWKKLERQRFLVKHSSKLLSLEVDQIAYFYAENRLNFIKTWSNKTYIIDKTIEEISNLLNPTDFFRINRSYIIAYKSIEEIYTHFNNRLKLKLNVAVTEEIFVSKDRVANFKEWLGA
jgi:DNA-binding LytR/AlgR family response regulator